MSSLEALQARIEALEAETTQLKEANEELTERVDKLETENEQLRDRLDTTEATLTTIPDISIDTTEKEPVKTLMIEDIPVGRKISGAVSEWTFENELKPALKTDLEACGPTVSSNGSPTPTDLTPIEQLTRAADLSELTNSVTTQRAVALFEHLTKWGQKTPKGYCLRAKDNPLALLEADQDESLCWKQYYRACEAVESLSNGAVTFVDSDRHGKMLVLHEHSEVYARLEGSLTASSVQAEG